MANLVTEDVEQRALTSCTVQLPFWKRYMDDTFTALPQEHIQNSIEPTIQFTIETEVEGTLPFLDTRVTRHADGSLTTSVFREKTHTDRYFYFDLFVYYCILSLTSSYPPYHSYSFYYIHHHIYYPEHS